MGSVVDARRRVFESRQRAIDAYVEMMGDNKWTIVTAEVCRIGVHISLYETEMFLFEANSQFLNS